MKLSVADTTILTYTIDVTCAGAKLGGLRTELQVGQTVTLQRGPKKARFRIVWVRQLTPKELHAGVECLEPQAGFLGVDLSEKEPGGDKNFDTLMTLLTKNSCPAPRQ